MSYRMPVEELMSQPLYQVFLFNLALYSMWDQEDIYMDTLLS
jgi:hypothetical protein